MKDNSRRVKARIKTKLKVVYKQVGQKDKNSCVSNDVSEDGLQLITDAALDANKSLLLEIELPYPKCTVHAIGIIRWHRESKDPDTGAPNHLYGIQYDEIEQADQDKIFQYMYQRIKKSADK